MSVRANTGNKSYRKTHKVEDRPPFERIALLLQGGGALGAYQGGVYQALSEAQIQPDWVAGISIGAVNAALIAGNPAETRLEKLRAFWEIVSKTPTWGDATPRAADLEGASKRDFLNQATTAAASISAMGMALASGSPLDMQAAKVREFWEGIGTSVLSFLPFDTDRCVAQGDVARGLLNQMSASLAVMYGVNGFFSPRIPIPWFHPTGTTHATSYYDSAPLKATLERLVDFDRINAAEMRFSVGAVNVGTGNFVYFDNTTHTIGPEHLMASCALPPGFPAIEIEGEHYWDGGLVSNTPLQWVLESEPRRDTLAFQVDLWSARGALPRNMAEVMTRQKEIQFSSRTRANSDRFKHIQTLHNALANLLEKLPDTLKDSPEFAVLSQVANRNVYNLVQLIYRSKQYEGDSKDYEFSRRSMEDHWRAGYHDTVRTLRHSEVLKRPQSLDGVLTFDLAQDGRE